MWADDFASIISSQCDCSVELAGQCGLMVLLVLLVYCVLLRPTSWRVWADGFASIISSLCDCSIQLAGQCGLMLLLVLLVHCVIAPSN